MANTYGRRSQAARDTLHWVLGELCDRVLAKRDITLLCGHRGYDAQSKAYISGASSKKWPDSTHNTTPSMAVDAAPYPIPEGWGDLEGQTLAARDLDWKERVKFYEMCASFEDSWVEMCRELPELGAMYRLRMGKDWDGDGDYRDQSFDDLPHIELQEK